MLLDLKELFKTNFDALDCQGQEGFKKGFNIGKVDATGHKVQIYAPKSKGCDHVGQMVTLYAVDEDEPMGLMDLAQFEKT